MSLAVIHSRALLGVRAPSVQVEVHLTNGLPAFNIVGLPDTEVKESRDRVRAAIQNSQLEFPNNRRITVNLAPADLPKESGRLDLPIAIGILAASEQLPRAATEGSELAGELSLGGDLRAIRGALAMAHAMSQEGSGRDLILPQASATQAALVRAVPVRAAMHLLDVVRHFQGSAPDDRLPLAQTRVEMSNGIGPDLSDLKGQAQARRALEIAAAGAHSLLLVGAPGCGKSMLAARLPGILPPMTDAEALSCAVVQSVAAQGGVPLAFGQRPLRAPHHSASVPALVGGGARPRPGEISLAHHGVLFLDELPEFDRRVLEALRQPLESGRVTISRAAWQADFDAAFQLVAAMNPCPCGYWGHPQRACHCTPGQIAQYQGRVSGPLLDRIDLHLNVPSLSVEELLSAPPGEPSALVRERVSAARDRAMQRQGKPNRDLAHAELDAMSRADAATTALLGRTIARLGWSARSLHRTLKIARSIADLAGSESLQAAHVAEAIQYRRALASPATSAGIGPGQPS